MQKTIVLFVLGCTNMLHGQSVSGSILGNIKDPGAMTVAGASITLTQTATGAVREAQSNHTGGFVFTNLAPGEYRLMVKHTGFKSTTVQSIVLPASETTKN